MKKATLKKDIHLYGYGTLKAGTSYEIQKINSRFAYLSIKQGLTARIKRTDIK